MRRLIYFVASTIDGFIASPDRSWDFFQVEPDIMAYIKETYPETIPTAFREHLGIDGPNHTIDTVVMGKGTYQPALDQDVTSPYAHLRQVVFSRSLQAPAGAGAEVEIMAGDPVESLRRLKREPGRAIWLCGGGDLAGQLLPEIDELVVKLHPVVAGSGIPLVRRDFDPTRFTLLDTRPFDSGVMVLRYQREDGR